MRKYGDARLSPMQVALLEEVRDHLRLVREGLDVSMERCDHCGRESAKEYAEYRLAQEIDGVVTKVERFLAGRSVDAPHDRKGGKS